MSAGSGGGCASFSPLPCSHLQGTPHWRQEFSELHQAAVGGLHPFHLKPGGALSQDSVVGCTREVAVFVKGETKTRRLSEEAEGPTLPPLAQMTSIKFIDLLRPQGCFCGCHALYLRWWAGALTWPFWTHRGAILPSAERVLLSLSCPTASAGLCGPCPGEPAASAHLGP